MSLKEPGPREFGKGVTNIWSYKISQLPDLNEEESRICGWEEGRVGLSGLGNKHRILFFKQPEDTFLGMICLSA